MKWLKRKIIKWVHEDWDAEYGEKGISLKDVNDVSNPVPECDPILYFRIYNAENGKILEFNRYDRTKVQDNVSIYIIGKDEDIAEKVSKCLMLETMK